MCAMYVCVVYGMCVVCVLCVYVWAVYSYVCVCVRQCMTGSLCSVAEIGTTWQINEVLTLKKFFN